MFINHTNIYIYKSVELYFSNVILSQLIYIHVAHTHMYIKYMYVSYVSFF